MHPNEETLLVESWPNAILHLDGDAFFASCEQSIHPELKGKPVITGQERNIVASMSYEAKARGIKRAVALWEAKKICPDAVILPSDYETYSLISKRMFSIMRRFTPDVEESSLDEGFADLKGLRRLYHTSYVGIAKQIRDTIERELDIPTSVGLSVTKTLAKLASKHEKPRGFTIVPGDELSHFLRKIPTWEVCGIGPNTTALLRKRGVNSVFDFVTKPELWAKELLGKIGTELWRELRGEKVYELVTKEKTTYESISKTKTFTPPSQDEAYVKAQLLRNTESAFIKLRRYHLRAKRLSVYLRHQDFQGAAMEGNLNRPTASPLEAFPLIEAIFKKIFRPGTLYRATGIWLSCLEEDGGMQFELFEDPVKVLAMRDLAGSIDQINAQYGKHTVFAATGLFLGQDKRKHRFQDGRQASRRASPSRFVDLAGRHALARRKTELLPGETFRQRLNIPLWDVAV